MGSLQRNKTHCKRGHEFTLENTRICNRRRVCRLCCALRTRQYRELRPKVYKIKPPVKTAEEVRFRQSTWQYKKLYGIDSLDERDAILESQGHACAICGVTGLTWERGFKKVWHTDHDHGKPGTHRGILCGRCNLALGELEPYIDKVIAYLVRWNSEEK
jgi:Recombination endonuclease VII